MAFGIEKLILKNMSKDFNNENNPTKDLLIQDKSHKTTQALQRVKAHLVQLKDLHRRLHFLMREVKTTATRSIKKQYKG